jgi:hypothetical protein
MDATEDTVRTIRDERYRYTLSLHPDRPEMQYNYYPDHLGTWADLRRLGHEEGEMLTLGLTPDILTDLQRSVMRVPRPAEELYDIAADPHETRNLADDPEHAETKQRLRHELQRWRDEYGDLGVIPEAELLDTWRPHGVEQTTAAPVVTTHSGAFVATCATEGASIAWTTDAPGPIGERSGIEKASGSPVPDGRRWHLYTGPVSIAPGDTAWFGAWRLGYAPSEHVLITGDAPAPSEGAR